MIRLAARVRLMVLTAVLLAPAAAATAEPPTPVDSTPEIIPAGEACPFAISVVATGKEGSNDLPRNPQFSAIAPAPGLKLTVTNVSEPDNSVTVNATGAFRFVDLPDGGTVIQASGHNFLYGDLSVGATALATTGPVTLRFSPDGAWVSMDVSRARVRGLCAELT